MHTHVLFVCADILLGNNSGEDYPEEFLLQIYERIQKVYGECILYDDDVKCHDIVGTKLGAIQTRSGSSS